jgi:hypothetical protein
MFPACMMSPKWHIEWSARSPNLNACDFFLWGCIKRKVCEKQPRTMDDLKENIRDEVAAVSPITLQGVIQNFHKRLQNVLTTMDTTSKK